MSEGDHFVDYGKNGLFVRHALHTTEKSTKWMDLYMVYVHHSGIDVLTFVSSRARHWRGTQFTLRCRNAKICRKYRRRILYTYLHLIDFIRVSECLIAVILMHVHQFGIIHT